MCHQGRLVYKICCMTSILVSLLIRVEGENKFQSQISKNKRSHNNIY